MQIKKKTFLETWIIAFYLLKAKKSASDNLLIERRVTGFSFKTLLYLVKDFCILIGDKSEMQEGPERIISISFFFCLWWHKALYWKMHFPF